MKVSILVPICGVENYICRCAESLFNQSYKDIEYIFVDDCSPDKSVNILRNIIKSYPGREDRVKIISHEINKGLAASRLTGIANATGNYVMFVDSDDYLEKDAVEILVDKVIESDNDIVTASLTHIFSNGYTFVDHPLQVDDKTECLKMMLERKTFLNVFPRIYRRVLFEKLQKPFVEGLNYGEDYLMTTRIFYYADKISFVDKPVYNYIHTNSESYTYQFKRLNFENLLKVDSVISDFYRKTGEKDLMESHQVGRLKLKSEQLIMYLRSKTQFHDDFILIKDHFKERQTEVYLSRLPLQDYLILKLSEIFPLWIMASYVRIGYSLKQIIKQIKQQYIQ